MMRAVVIALLVSACTADPPRLETTSQAATVCADGPTTYGIDVSRYQGDMDWSLVAGSGVQYAWIQISRSLTDIDMKFDYNWPQAKANGILRGAYQRFRPGMDVIGQAKLFVDKLLPVFEPGDLPPMLDVEDADGLSAPEIAAAVQEWMDYVEPRVGLTPLIYTGYYFWRDSVGDADLSKYPLWIANYSAACPLVPGAWTRWAIHQYSSTVTVPGVTVNTVDVIKFNGTLDDLKAMAKPAVATCGDGTCNGEETTDSCAADCTACQVIGDGADAIVDDTGPCFTAGGNPDYVRKENAGYGSWLQWTHATDAAAAGNYGRWDLHFSKAGTYRIEASTPAPFNGSKQATYAIHHAGQVTRVTIDQSAVDGWSVLGELEFAAKGEQYIRLDDNTGEPESTETKLVFDALRLTQTDAGSDSGCSSTSTTSCWVLLAGILLRKRRKRRAMN